MNSSVHLLKKRRRVPWVTQKKKDVRKIVRDYSVPLFSPRNIVLFKYFKQGAENMSLELKHQLLRENAGEIVHSLHRLDTKVDGSIFKQTLIKNPASINEQLANSLINLWSKQYLEKQAKELNSLLEKRAAQYLKARNIPVNRDSLVAALSQYISKNSARSFVTGFAVKEFEKYYFEMQKINRYSKQEDAIRINSFGKQIWRGLNFTLPQKKAVKRWLRRSLPSYLELRLKVLRESDGSFFEAFARINRLEKEFILSARNYFVQEFRTSLKKTDSFVPNVAQVTKLGLRQERLMEYANANKERTQKERVKEITKLQEQASVTHKPFDSVRYCLTEMMKENESSGKTIGTLFQNRQINGSAVVSLFTSGSLTQKTFLDIIQKSEFVVRFGIKELSNLARGLAFIGPKGKKISSARRAFQSPNKDAIFSFLENKGFLETQHGGGKVVYLARGNNRK